MPVVKSPSSIQKQLQKLTRLPAGRHPIVSCYLKLEPRDRSGGKYRIKMKNRIREVAQALPRLGLERAEHESVLADLRRIQDHLDRVSNLPGARGIAIFASAGHKLFEAIPLPRVFRSRLGVDRTALVGELAAIEDELGTFLTVVLDRTTARIWEVSAFEARPVEEFPGTAVRGRRFHASRGDAPGVGEAGYHGRIRAEKQRHYAVIAERLFALDKARPVRGIVLAAPGVEAASVEPFLHPYLGGRVIGRVKLNPKEASAADVHAATLEARERHEREEERAWIAELREKTATGWAVNGVRETLRALSQGKVRALLVRPDAVVPGFRCRETGRLCLTERDCRLEGGGMPVLDVIDDAIEEALRQHLVLDVVYDPTAAQSVEGLAAPSRPIRVLVAKPGLDGHDRGAKVVAAALRDAGMEVIYTGLHQTPEMIASAAVQEDVDVVGLSILSGAHMTLFPRVRRLLDEQGRPDILITGGGIIPAEDMEALAALGVGRLFGPGTATGDLVTYIREWAAAHRAD